MSYYLIKSPGILFERALLAVEKQQPRLQMINPELIAALLGAPQQSLI